MSANAGSSAIRSLFLQHITDPAAGRLITHSAGSTANHRLDPMVIDEASVRILVPGALENWRFTYWSQYLGTGIAANDFDTDGDGIPNIVEYIMSLNPTVPGGLGHSPPVGLSHDVATGDMIADLRLLTAYDSRVRLTIQYSQNLAASWSTLSTRTGTGVWSPAPRSTTLLSGGSRTSFNFDVGEPALTPKAFYRLKAEELP